MKINLYEIKSEALQDFAERIGLVMVVRERDLRALSSLAPSDRYCARFEDCVVKEGRLLAGTCGNGATPEEAMIDYMRHIEGCLLVCGAYRHDRREIRVPGKLHWGRP